MALTEASREACARGAAALYLWLVLLAHGWLALSVWLLIPPLTALWGLLSLPLSLAAAALFWRHARQPHRLRPAIALTIAAANVHALAIAAALTGSKLAVGTDIDGPSVRISNENAKLNKSTARFVHASGLGHQLVAKAAPYDLVFANILAPPLVALSQDIRRALKPGGFAILSGLLRTQERRVLAAYLSKGFRLHRRLHRDAWATLVLRRA